MMPLGKNIVTSEQVSNFKQVNKQKLANFKKYIYIYWGVHVGIIP